MSLRFATAGPPDARTAYAVSLAFERWAAWPLQSVVNASCAPPIAVVGAATFGTVAPEASVRARITEQLLTDHFGPVRRAALRGGHHGRLIEHADDKMALDRDALTAIFHLVSGEDEVSSAVRDSHERFPSDASLLQRHGVLDLPVADLLAEYLQDRVRAHHPGLPVAAPANPVVVSHDIDAPFKLAFKTAAELPRLIVGDVVRRRRLDSLWRTPLTWRVVRAGHLHRDPFNCFDRILAGHRKAGRQADFFFIAGHTGGRIDGDYTLDDAPIRTLLTSAARGGHRIGLHPSYHASIRADDLATERHKLAATMKSLGLSDDLRAVRTHYLRFDPLRTPGLLQRAGFEEDSSLSFADAAGFRRATCRTFPLWSHETGHALDLIEKPLIAMDASLIRYEGLSHEAAAARIDTLRAECSRHGGTFSLLWHNNYFTDERDFELYEYAIR
jgi:hypothetical protein